MCSSTRCESPSNVNKFAPTAINLLNYCCSSTRFGRSAVTREIGLAILTIVGFVRCVVGGCFCAPSILYRVKVFSVYTKSQQTTLTSVSDVTFGGFAFTIRTQVRARTHSHSVLVFSLRPLGTNTRGRTHTTERSSAISSVCQLDAADIKRLCFACHIGSRARSKSANAFGSLSLSSLTAPSARYYNTCDWLICYS